MVPKKNGGWRLCSDYTPVNGVTRKDSYPLLRINKSLDLSRGHPGCPPWIFAVDITRFLSLQRPDPRQPSAPDEG